MADNVDITINGTSADAQQAWIQLASVVEKLDDKIRQVGRAGLKANKDIASGIKGVQDQVSDAIKRWVSLNAVMSTASRIASIATREIEGHSEYRGRAYQKQVSVAEAYESFRFNYGATNATEMVKSIIKNSGGVDFSDAFRETVQALSTRGAVDEKMAMMVSQLVQKTRPALNSEERSKVISAVLNTIRAKGITGTYTDDRGRVQRHDEAWMMAESKKAAGFVFASLTAAPQSEIGKFSDNLIGGMLQWQNANPDKQTDIKWLMSTLIGIGQASGDPNGMRTRNTLNTFLQVFEELRREGILSERDDFQSMMGVIQTNKEAQEVVTKLLGVFQRRNAAATAAAGDDTEKRQLRGEASMLAALIQVFRAGPRDSTFWKEFGKVQNMYRDKGALDKYLDSLNADLRKDPMMRSFFMDRAGNQANQMAQLDGAQAIRFFQEDRLKDIEKQLGLSIFNAGWTAWFQKWRKTHSEAEQMDSIIKEIENARRGQAWGANDARNRANDPVHAASFERNVEILEALLVEMKGIRDGLEGRPADAPEEVGAP